jgi:PTS system nitrogen regulatory IIA component
MTISALLSPQCIFLDTEITSKKKLLELIANVVAERTQLSESSIYSNLLSRERLGSTALGQGFAVPHARLDDLDRTLACFFRLKEAVNFEAPDNRPVDLVFAIIIPEEATDEHLVILSSLARIFSNENICESIRQAANKDEIARIIESAEQ